MCTLPHHYSYGHHDSKRHLGCETGANQPMQLHKYSIIEYLPEASDRSIISLSWEQVHVNGYTALEIIVDSCASARFVGVNYFVVDVTSLITSSLGDRPQSARGNPLLTPLKLKISIA